MIEPDLPVPAARRASLWLITLSMVLIIGLKSHPAPLPGVPWHLPGWAALAAGLALAWAREGNSRWARTSTLLGTIRDDRDARAEVLALTHSRP